jgi:predicted nucleic acid-binding protein
MRVLLDTDVVMDVMVARLPFAQTSGQLLDLASKGTFEAYVSSITPINIFYVARKAKSVGNLRDALSQLLQTVRVCPIDHSVLTAALDLPFADYEDAVQHAAAAASKLDAIVTRNLKDYGNATLPVFSPVDFLNQLTPPQE